MARDTLVAALPAAHPLAQRETLDIAAFDREPFIDYDPDDARYCLDLVWRSFSTHGVAPEVTQSVSQPHTMISMVRAGLGLALVAGWVQHHTVSRDLVFRPLVWTEPPPLESRLVWQADRRPPHRRISSRSHASFRGCRARRRTPLELRGNQADVMPPRSPALPLESAHVKALRKGHFSRASQTDRGSAS